MGRRERRTFTAEYKANAVRLVREGGRSIREVAEEFDLTETSLREWVRRAGVDEARSPNGPLTTEERAELVRLRREFRTVTMERDFLKKAAAFFAKGRT